MNRQPIISRQHGTATARSFGLGGLRAAAMEGRAPWLAMVAALLLALTWQSFVTQTHFHYSPETVSAAALDRTGGVTSGIPAKRVPSQLPDNCPICREIAHAGAVVLPAPVVVFAPFATPFLAAPSVQPGVSRAGSSHIWRSRAPPAQLPA